MIYTTIDSPVGELLLAGDGEVLQRLSFMQGRHPVVVAALGWQRDDGAFGHVRDQLAEFFAGSRQVFDVPLTLHGTEWELRVWNALLEIPYGETCSYGDIARAVGARPVASRAVGLANGRNPIALIVPCHRVIGADGKLTGYGGGLDNKRYLLDLEAGRLALT